MWDGRYAVRKALLILAFATAFGVMFPTAGRAQDLRPMDKATHVTFSGPVSLPGVSLPAGTYLFRFADVSASSVLEVLSEDGKTSYAMINTIPIERTAEASEKSAIVTFKETPADAPPAIDAWFFDETLGCEVVY
jgi:hypothetical protein